MCLQRYLKAVLSCKPSAASVIAGDSTLDARTTPSIFPLSASKVCSRTEKFRVMNSEPASSLDGLSGMYELNKLAEAVHKEVRDLPEKLKFPLLDKIRDKVMTLLAQLHTMAENPIELYPRLLCGSIPVDPAKVTKFTKQYRILQQLNDIDDGISQNDRSLSAPPKSSAEVIEKVVSSAQGLSDAVLKSINELLGLGEDFEEIKEFEKTLSQVKEPIGDLLNQQEEIYRMINRLKAMFFSEDVHSEKESDGERERDFGAGILETVQSGSTLLDNVIQSRSVLEDSVSKIRNLKGLFVEQTNCLQKRLDKICGLFEILSRVFKQFVANLPRLAREIRQFFVPTGWRAFVMRPSDVLMSVLANFEDLRATLPDPDLVQPRSTNPTENSDLIGRMKETKENMEELMLIPCRLIDGIQEQDFQHQIVATVKNTLVSMLDELTVSAAARVKDGVEGMLGQFVDGVENLFPQNSSSSYSSAPTKDEKKGVLAKLMGEVQGGWFKAIF
eukprot:gb/GEZJ01003360.1/.p1 GENE.gb/GEZJ01003360.1/~~gb/GEZJ01003360.1/.p1  ORF type:complete len:501 (+),score=83.87 gb/GEZJ01003360.1/:4799-6301(+)